MAKRVAIYNRCSTEEESQRNALASQAAESREIAEKMGWLVAEQYIESETGTVAYKRGQYQRLLQDMETGRFDIVMIKSIDRLTRSAKDWYFFLSRLTEHQLKLYIYIERKYYTPDDNLISGIKAILAEDFSRELSKKIKNAHRRRQEKRSGLNITCEMFGWKKIRKDVYELNPEEAAYYRMAFRLAEEGKGFYTISNRLFALGARTRNGKKISQVQWRNMLYTPRAHGTMVLNTRSYNFDIGKYEKVPEEEWIYVENALPPLVSREYQEKVLRILSRRAKERDAEGKQNTSLAGKYELSHKIICAECGSCYYRAGSTKKEGCLWKCSRFLKNGRKRGGENPIGCDGPNVGEGQVWRVMEKEFEKKQGKLPAEQKENMMEEFLKIAEKGIKAADSHQEEEKLLKEQEGLRAKKNVLLDKWLSEVISDLEFRRYEAELEQKEKALKERIEEIRAIRQKRGSSGQRLGEIRQFIRENALMEEAAARMMLKKTDHILVGRDGSLTPVYQQEFCK